MLTSRHYEQPKTLKNHSGSTTLGKIGGVKKICHSYYFRSSLVSMPLYMYIPGHEYRRILNPHCFQHNQDRKFTNTLFVEMLLIIPR
jgi:hypothetical protein